MFTVIILFFVLAGIIFFQILRSAYSFDQPEFRVVPITQYLQRLHSSEHDAAKKYFESKDSFNDQTLSLIGDEFDKNLDSLKRIIDRDDIRPLADRVFVHHAQYREFLARQRTRIKKNPAYDPMPALKDSEPLSDSIRQSLESVTMTYLPALSRSLGKLSDRTSVAMSGAGYALLLTVGIAIAIALISARELTRPIKLLQAGTEKVGEGLYETVPITTNDEIGDLTKRFNLMSDKLKQLEAMRTQMMSEISHEMRTPLQVIKAGCYTVVHMKDGPVLNERQREAVGMIHQATNRINQFVNLFLDVAKMEAGLMKFKFEVSNLVDVLQPLVMEAQLIAETRQIKVDFDAQAIEPLSFDKDRMSQVFSNLLSNALKFTPNNGTISVRLARETECGQVKTNGKGCIRIQVKDSGVGIPEADLKRLFNKFYQAKNVPLVNEKGSGLGLALVKHVAEAHGGSVSVESQVGVGSTFTVVLPG
ncbi:MAG TPA: HAMP domain-containing sensor histidine kinase [Bacteroidota bacterium]|nr:HAMP domain-containing sensor histidine kinase [Bacteroidota bacterium]